MILVGAFKFNGVILRGSNSRPVVRHTEWKSCTSRGTQIPLLINCA